MSDEIEVLSKTEAGDLAQCEKTIERTKASFKECGQALITIRDQRLFRASYKTFESYCAGRHGLSKAHAYRFIDAVEVLNNLQEHLPKKVSNGDLSTLNESHLRQLSTLEPKQQVKAVERAIELGGQSITTKAVKEAVQEIIDPPAPKPEPKPMPSKSLAHWEKENGRYTDLFRPILGELSGIAKAIESAQNPYLAIQPIQIVIRQVASDLRACMPVQDCPKCGAKGCAQCRKSGWLTKHAANFIPKD